MRIGSHPPCVSSLGEAENGWARATTDNARDLPGTEPSIARFIRMPGANRAERHFVESARITAYKPPCNQQLTLDFSKLFGAQ
jgi:hypothetical protein